MALMVKLRWYIGQQGCHFLALSENPLTSGNLRKGGQALKLWGEQTPFKISKQTLASSSQSSIHFNHEHYRKHHTKTKGA